MQLLLRRLGLALVALLDVVVLRGESQIILGRSGWGPLLVPGRNGGLDAVESGLENSSITCCGLMAPAIFLPQIFLFPSAPLPFLHSFYLFPFFLSLSLSLSLFVFVSLSHSLLLALSTHLQITDFLDSPLARMPVQLKTNCYNYYSPFFSTRSFNQMFTSLMRCMCNTTLDQTFSSLFNA
jgi:hypothetical protein